MVNTRLHDTVYIDELSKANVNLPKEYPNRPPKMKMANKIWQPNIDKNGDVSISIPHEPSDDAYGYEKACERWLPLQSKETIGSLVITTLADQNDQHPKNVGRPKESKK